MTWQKRTTAVMAGLMTAWLGASALAQNELEYETGGPLAGVKLPLYETHHGEPAGYPGVIPGEFDDEGLPPQMQLYPGSVEHWRAYMFKYMPIRSFFDQQSQIRNWNAGELGVAAARLEEYAEPVFWVPRHRAGQDTGRLNPPVQVARLSVHDPLLELDLGELDRGLYVVRVIGAVPPEDIRPFREPLFMSMQVNDGLEGEQSSYRRRLGYSEEFYSVAEMYFHAPERRHYRATLALDEGSTVDLLVHNVSLDDVMAGVSWSAIKQRTTIHSAVPEAEAKLAERREAGQNVPEPMSREARFDRDAKIWRGFPHINMQGSSLTQSGRRTGYGLIANVEAGANGMTDQQIVEQHGAWRPWVYGRRGTDMTLPEGVTPQDVFLVNTKLGLIYTIDDMQAGRPLPDPYPIKDDGAGVYEPDPEDPAKGNAWTPIGEGVHKTYTDYYRRVGSELERYKQTGERDHAHDAAMALVRWAYAFPTLDYSEYLSSTVHRIGPFGRDYSTRRRETIAFFLPHYKQYVQPIMFQYDELYEFIKDNQQLADSVGRFVPWVKTPEDVIELIDVYLVQTTAKRIMRYHYHTDPMDLANLAAVVGDNYTTDAWMDWIFTRTHVYPLPPAGIQDLMISGTQREGTEFVGSTYYAGGEGAQRIAQSLDLYISTGGNETYDLSDPKRYPKPSAHAHWQIDRTVAGRDFLRIGDVTGPDKAPGATLSDLDFARPAFNWTQSPRFAFIIKHYLGRDQETDEQWANIEQQAAKLDRAPWLDNRSRVMPNWAGILETGHQHDDPRFRRAAYLRIGYGWGHHHDDTFDLQVVAHGLPMTIDGGQRPGYTTPGDRSTLTHNTVMVDGQGHRDHSWASALSDHQGARYLAVTGAPPAGASLFRRQIALIDVNEGEGSAPLPIDQQGLTTSLPAGVTTANSYVFDVFRVAGGKAHTYGFHGPLHDDFQWNASNVAAPVEGTPEAAHLAPFKRMPEMKQVGDAPDTLEATWRYAIEVEGTGRGEMEMLGKNYDPQSPRKFTRLHLLGADDATAMRAQSVSQQWGYDFTHLMAQRRDEAGGLQSAFAAIIEPYAGEPFVQSRKLLEVADNEADAQRAVAVQVMTTTGHRDVLLADGRPDRVRSVPEAKLRAAGEFAYVSTDAHGLRQATLTGGTLLHSPQIRLDLAEGQRTARVVEVDYLEKQMWIDGAWPAHADEAVIEVGLPDADHWTSYTAVDVQPQDGRTLVQLNAGGDYFRSPISSINAEAGTVTCVLTPTTSYAVSANRGWVASNEEQTRFWRADYDIDTNTFTLSGAPVDEAIFGEQPVLRLWEYGVGDVVRQSTSAAVRRVQDGVYEVTGNVDLTLALPVSGIERSADGENWQPIQAEADGDWRSLRITAADLAGGPLYLRVQAR